MIEYATTVVFKVGLAGETHQDACKILKEDSFTPEISNKPPPVIFKCSQLESPVVGIAMT